MEGAKLNRKVCVKKLTKNSLVKTRAFKMNSKSFHALNNFQILTDMSVEALKARKDTGMNQNHLAPKRRKNYWINPKLQKAIILRTLIANFVLVGFLYLADRIFFMRMSDMGTSLGLQPDHVYYVFLKEQERVKFWIFMATAGVISIATTWAGLFVSHRIAGPVVRIRNELRRLAQGEKVGQVVLRDADFFQEVADEFNSMTLNLKLRKDSTKAESDEKKTA